MKDISSLKENSQDSPSSPTTVNKLQSREISYKIPNVLGLVFAAIAVTIIGGGRINVALMGFLGYLLGYSVGYIIEILRVQRIAKVILALIVGVMIGGGSLLVNAILDIRQVQTQQDFPSLSSTARHALRERVSGMSEAQARQLLWQLMAEGETLLSEADKNEMTSLYWEAIQTLTPEESMFIGKVGLEISQGQGYSVADQEKTNALVQKGFANLSEKDNNRYLQIRSKTVELALLKPQEAEQQFKSTYSPIVSSSNINYMTLEQKKKRMQELTEKAISLLPEKDRARFLELQLTLADQLTKEQYAERVKYSEKIVTLLSESELREMMELTAELSGKQ